MNYSIKDIVKKDIILDNIKLETKKEKIVKVSEKITDNKIEDQNCYKDIQWLTGC